MTKVRVLSGEHAGASIDWTGQTLRVGANDECDVYIGDWELAGLELVRAADGGCEAQWPVGSEGPIIEGASLEGGRFRIPLPALQPVRFGSVILCLGPSDSAWPSDVDLLQQLFAPPSEPVAPPPRFGKGIVMIVAGVVVAGTVASVAHTAARRSVDAPGASTAPTFGAASLERELAADAPGASTAPTSGAVRLQRELAEAQWPDLEVVERADRYFVVGLVHSRQDAAAVQKHLALVRADKVVVNQVVAALDVVDLIRESVPEAELVVNRVSARRFEITGVAKQADQANRAVARLAADLAPVGISLESAIKPLVTSSPRVSGTLTDATGLSYKRTQDGVKHIVVGDQAASAAPESGRQKRR